MTEDLDALVERPSWILECGCDSMSERCDQCDGRRKIREIVRMERRKREARQLLGLES